MDPIKVDFTGKGSSRKKEIVIPPERAALKVIISIVGTIALAGLYYYLMLPPLNPKAIEFYMYIGAIFATYIALTMMTTKAMAKPEYIPYVKRQSIVPGVVIGILALVVVVGFIISSVFFRAHSYSKLIPVNTEGVFTQDIEKQNAESYSNIPRLDEAAAANLATKALSNLNDVGKVSQFTVYPMYTQINYKGVPVRVSTLQYANIIKWFTNRSEGLPGYTIIDMANQTTKFVELKDGMKYSPAEHFGRLLKRQLRFQYPTYLFAEANFQIKDDGTPIWLTARLDKTIGLFGGTTAIGAVLTNPINGTSEYYTLDQLRHDPKLQWIDRVFSSDLLIQQFNYFGKYSGGFWNSILGQKDVRITTDGFNYIAKDDDVFLYTGVTSITSDQSIIGFILINMRTQDATIYKVTGTTEQAAMLAAEGKVKAYAFAASFPLLINVSNQPTYFMALKDSNEVNQKFAMVNVQQFNKIFVVGDSLADCLSQYLVALKNAGIKTDINISDLDSGTDNNNPTDVKTKTVSGVIESIRTAVIGGESYYYIKLVGVDAYYSISASKAEEIIIANTGDKITAVIPVTTGKIVPADSIKIVK
ncbi:MAG: CvpA family protein [Eubacteriales bacterium]